VTIGVIATLGLSACDTGDGPSEAAGENVADSADTQVAPAVTNAVDGEAVYNCDGRSVLPNAGNATIELPSHCGLSTSTPSSTSRTPPPS